MSTEMHPAAKALREAALEAERIHGIGWTQVGKLSDAARAEFDGSPLRPVAQASDDPLLNHVARWLRDRADEIEARAAEVTA